MSDTSRLDADTVREQANVIGYYSSHIELKPVQGTLVGSCCPNCSPGHSPSFKVSPDLLWYCHRCQVGGDIFKFVEETTGLRDFPDQVRYLAEWDGQRTRTSTPRAKLPKTEKTPVPFDLEGRDAKILGHPITQRFEYQDAAGKIVAVKARADFIDGSGEPDRTFCWCRPSAESPTGWYRGAPAGGVPLYRLPLVIDAIHEGHNVFVVEGETDCDALNGAFPDNVKFAATTAPNGSSGLSAAHVGALNGARLTVWADDDDAGHRHAKKVVGAVKGVVRSLRVVVSPWGKDPRDHVEAGHSLEAVTTLWVMR